MITRERLSELVSFRPEHYLTTTLYLTIDAAPNPIYLITIKDLLKTQQQRLRDASLSPEVRKSVEEDLKKIADYVRLEFERNGVRTLVICSCAATKFWVVLTMKLPLPDQLEVGPKPYLRPLTLLLEEYHRYLVILVERSKARLFEAYAGEIQEYIDLFDNVPGKVRVGGYEERRIERHIEDHVRRHFRHVAEVAFELYKRYTHDYVILLGSELNTNEFHHYLHTTLHQRIADREVEEITASVQDVFRCVKRIETRIKEQEDQQLLRKLFDEVRSGGLGVVGLDSTIRALQQGQVNALIVEDFRKQGYRCRNCGNLSTHEGPCDYCNEATEPVPDIVEQTVLEAMNQGCQVKYISIPQSELSSAGKIGALLRFKT